MDDKHGPDPALSRAGVTRSDRSRSPVSRGRARSRSPLRPEHRDIPRFLDGTDDANYFSVPAPTPARGEPFRPRYQGEPFYPASSAAHGIPSNPNHQQQATNSPHPTSNEPFRPRLQAEPFFPASSGEHGEPSRPARRDEWADHEPLHPRYQAGTTGGFTVGCAHASFLGRTSWHWPAS